MIKPVGPQRQRNRMGPNGGNRGANGNAGVNGTTGGGGAGGNAGKRLKKNGHTVTENGSGTSFGPTTA